MSLGKEFKAPFLIILFSLAAGIGLGFMLDISLLILIISQIGLIIGIIICWYYELELSKVLILIFILLAGLTLVQNLEYQYQNSKVVTDYAGEYIKVKGRVVEKSKAKKETKYILEPEMVIQEGKEDRLKHGKVLLKLKDEGYNYGDVLEVTGRLRLPMTNRNPGGFSYRDYLKQQGVYSLLSDRKVDRIRLIGNKGNPLIKLSLQFKSHAGKILDKTVDEPYNLLLRGLLLGEKELLPNEIMNKFEQVGLNHLLVISGFHIGLLVLILNSICRGLKLPVKLADLMAIFLIIGYIIITYGQASVVRAGTVVILYIIGRWFNRKVNIYNILSLVAVIILIYNPYYLLRPSFQLSFMVVYSIIYLTPVLQRRLFFLPSFVARVLAASIAAQLGAFPILVYHFNRISFGPIIGNILVMPVVSLIIFLGFISLLVGNLHLIFAQLLNNISYLLSTFLLELVGYLMKFDFLTFKLPRPNLLVIGIYYFLFFQSRDLLAEEIIPNFQRKREKIILGLLIILLCILVSEFSYILDDGLEAVFLDVGQGSASLLSLPSGKKVLIDGGPDKDLVADFLYQNGVSQLELIILSHFHSDHYKGLFRVIKEFEVDRVLVPEPAVQNEIVSSFFQMLKKKGIDYREIKGGGKYDLGKVKFNFYHYPGSISDPNNNSLITRLSYNDFQILFTGDAEKKVEEYLLQKKVPVDSEVLKVGHHGSDSSSKLDFLQQVKPKLSVISVGRWNRYNLPDAGVINRLESIEAEVFETKEEGAVIIESDGEKYWLQQR
ncbi:DNA internalization-related competence protein ComEC/Rec2 [Acetohalobium arabaticum]|uniref:DNA internalization-related competence protein ComEC/Rec2 n=1 Tax=Acetohalobium arabaticum (strain ATCC 49924 / DSM 5501 / Z-7288) TaxID=574087 RepID=D9QV67_ACEAZ|nr:DNA internalization-related competence protein ComEC/Rec2 [Acetohalobium arabaticum]ADL12126.1 DNA internalization-related competence protein ComEC/Rec2 [Acetohalobium arabaticum DSM 5501]